jgi:SAM-dependent methyltransferase
MTTDPRHPDFGRTAADYARHRAGFPPAFFERLRAAGIGLPGQRALDLGTGTGTVARGLALGGCVVTGVDIAAPLMEQARALDREAGVTIDYAVAPAEDTGLPAASFDLVTAGQCWHWFDRPRAAAEAYRLLKPGGALVVAHFDWLPLPGNVVEATESLILRHSPDWHLGGGAGIYPAWPVDVAVAGFVDIETASFDIVVPYTNEAWRGRIRASAAIAASLSPDGVAAFEAEHAAMLAARFPEDPLSIPHRTWWLSCRKAG